MDRGDYHRRQYEFLLPPATALAPVQQRQHQVCVPMMMDEQFSAGRGGPETRGQRKQRFTDEQIRSLESMFHAHHAKLDPREKADLARDLGLQPRQVAIWFQNKRARWRSKQLEHDYAALRAKFDALHSCVEALKQEKIALTSQLHELSERLTERGGAATTASSSSCNDDDRRNAVGCVDIKPPESCVLGGTACATPADVSVDSECDDRLAYDGGFPESFCATPELWEPWPLIEWNAVA